MHGQCNNNDNYNKYSSIYIVGHLKRDIQDEAIRVQRHYSAPPIPTPKKVPGVFIGEEASVFIEEGEKGLQRP